MMLNRCLSTASNDDMTSTDSKRFGIRYETSYFGREKL